MERVEEGDGDVKDTSNISSKSVSHTSHHLNITHKHNTTPSPPSLENTHHTCLDPATQPVPPCTTTTPPTTTPPSTPQDKVIIYPPSHSQQSHGTLSPPTLPPTPTPTTVTVATTTIDLSNSDDLPPTPEPTTTSTTWYES